MLAAGTQAPAPVTEFDLTAVTSQINRTKGQLRAIGAGVLVFWSAMMAFFVFAAVKLALEGLESTFILAAVAIVVGSGIFIIRSSLRGLKANQPAARRLCIDSRGIEISYPAGRRVVLLWESPDFSLELHDFTGRSSSQHKLSTPFAMRVEGVDSTLTEEAYGTLISELRKRNLLRDAKKVRWFGAAASWPVVHYAYHEGHD